MRRISADRTIGYNGNFLICWWRCIQNLIFQCQSAKTTIHGASGCCCALALPAQKWINLFGVREEASGGGKSNEIYLYVYNYCPSKRRGWIGRARHLVVVVAGLSGIESQYVIKKTSGLSLDRRTVRQRASPTSERPISQTVYSARLISILIEEELLADRLLVRSFAIWWINFQCPSWMDRGLTDTVIVCDFILCSSPGPGDARRL